MAGGKTPFLLLAFVLMFVFAASAHRPLVVEKHEVAAAPPHNIIDGHKREKMDMGKWEMKGEGQKIEHDDALKTNGLGVGLYDAPNPVSYPGVDAGVHIDLGPFGFGLQGGLQWGGNPYPVYVVPPPYVMVSPYSGSYPYPTPYVQPSSGNGSPQPGHDGFYPPTGSYAQGQGQGQGPYQGG